MQNRVDSVIELLAQKFKRAQIIQYCNSHFKHWDVSDRAIDTYIRKARAQLLDQMRITRTELRSEAVSDLRYLYKKALEDNDLRAALSIRKELSGMLLLSGPVSDEEAGYQLPDRDAEDQDVPSAVDELMGRHIEVVALPDVDSPEPSTPEIVVPTPKKEKPGPALSSLGY